MRFTAGFGEPQGRLGRDRAQRLAADRNAPPAEVTCSLAGRRLPWPRRAASAGALALAGAE